MEPPSLRAGNVTDGRLRSVLRPGTNCGYEARHTHQVMRLALRLFDQIPRYHRGSLPCAGHDHFAQLDTGDRQIVEVLAGIVRVADGLDDSHQSIVTDLACEADDQQILVRCVVLAPAEAERQDALDRGDLIEWVFGRKLLVEWCLARERRHDLRPSEGSGDGIENHPPAEG